LVEVLTGTRNALARQYAKLMAIEGVELEFTNEALRELAVQAIRKGTGARALRTLLEKLMLDVMYDVPSSDDVVHVKITHPVVLGECPPLVRRRAAKVAA
jgi:ATP-dependent Clp protease ATP-binding subunit ClpX